MLRTIASFYLCQLPKSQYARTHPMAIPSILAIIPFYKLIKNKNKQNPKFATATRALRTHFSVGSSYVPNAASAVSSLMAADLMRMYQREMQERQATWQEQMQAQ